MLVDYVRVYSRKSPPPVAQGTAMITIDLAPGPRPLNIGAFAFPPRARLAVSLPGQVDVLLSTDAELRRLNRDFRGKNKPTDVLSFPSPAIAPHHAGDLAISLETAARQAETFSHPLADEVSILTPPRPSASLRPGPRDRQGRNGHSRNPLRGELRLPRPSSSAQPSPKRGVEHEPHLRLCPRTHRSARASSPWLPMSTVSTSRWANFSPANIRTTLTSSSNSPNPGSALAANRSPSRPRSFANSPWPPWPSSPACASTPTAQP